jgi:cbb3-type cytochrome oxidase subunit 3
MFKHILENAGNINWMALFALVTFFTLFIIGIVTVFGKDKAFIEKMSNLPLDDEIKTD